MVKRLFWKAPAMLAVFCLAFVLVLTGCDGTGSPANNNNGGGGIENGGGGNDNNGNDNGNGGNDGNGGNGQQPPANEFIFGGETTPLNFAAFSTDFHWEDITQIWGFSFLLQTSETMNNWEENTIHIMIPVGLMNSEIDLNDTYEGWSLIFLDGDGYEAIDYFGRGPTPTAGTMQVERADTTTNRFRITIDVDGDTPFRAHFYGEFEEKDTFDIMPPWF